MALPQTEYCHWITILQRQATVHYLLDGVSILQQPFFCLALEIFNQTFKLWCRNENYCWRQALLCRSHNSNNNLGRPTPTAIYQNSWTWSEQSSSSSACFTTRSIAFWMGDATYKHCKSLLCWSQYKDYNLGWYEIFVLLDASILHSQQFF